MDTKITLDASAGIQAIGQMELAIPETIPQSILSGNVISSAVMLANFLLGTGFRIFQIAVKLDRETKIHIAYYDEFRNTMIEFVIPQLAKADAIQQGINYVRHKRYDPQVSAVVLQRLLNVLEI